MNTCSDTLCGILNSQVSWTKLSIRHVLFSRSPLSKARADGETHWGCAAIDPQLHWHCFYVFYSSSAALLLFFFHLSLPLLTYPLLSLFLTPKCESLSIFRCSAPLDFSPFISPPFFFYHWRTDSQKALQDSSVLYSSCFLIRLMSDNAAWGSYLQMCFFYKRSSIYM